MSLNAATLGRGHFMRVQRERTFLMDAILGTRYPTAAAAESAAAADKEEINAPS